MNTTWLELSGRQTADQEKQAVECMVESRRLIGDIKSGSAVVSKRISETRQIIKACHAFLLEFRKKP